MCCQCACSNMHNKWCLFASDFVHIRNHQQQPLGRSKCRCQRTHLQRAMHCTGRPALGLHFYNLWDCTPDIFLVLERPFVRQFAHCAAGGNGINCRKIDTSVCNIGRGPVSINNKIRHNNTFPFELFIFFSGEIIPRFLIQGKIILALPVDKNIFLCYIAFSKKN